jgi:hypothetical protein
LLHGKEGVSGSSPEEGFDVPATGDVGRDVVATRTPGSSQRLVVVHAA